MTASEPLADRLAAEQLDDDGRALYHLEYHVLLVTRRRKALFADEERRQRCHELLMAVCDEQNCQVERLTVNPSTITLHVFAPPTLAPHMLVQKLREVAGPLRAEFPEVVANGGAFIRRYIVTTAPTPETACEAFLDRVPTR